MGFHTFDVDRAANLEDESRYRYCSREELLAFVAPYDGMVAADLGSGTGFYTDDVAPYVDKLYAVDVQSEMHDLYREKELPETVETVTADVSDLPLEDRSLDAAFSTFTFHEFASEENLGELARVLRSGGRLAVVDWSAEGEGHDGPPVDERYGPGDAVSMLGDAGFVAERVESRRETFACVARRR